MVKRFDVYMCDQNGVQKPCLIVSPDEMNEVLPYVMIAPITTASYQFPTRVIIGLKGKKGQIALDMITTIDKTELIQLKHTITTHFLKKQLLSPNWMTNS